MALQSNVSGNLVHCWWLYWPKFSAGVPLKNISRDSHGKYWNICGFVIKCWYFFSRRLGVLKCSTIVSVHNLFLIPFFNCVLSDWLKFLSAQCLFLWAILNRFFGVWLCLFVQWSNLLIEYEIIHMMFCYLIF